MSVSMNRVWSLYLMMQIIGNISDLQNFIIPSNAQFILNLLFNISNFKIFQNKTVKTWMEEHIFGRFTSIQDVIFGQGILVTGLIALTAILVLVALLKLIRAEKLVKKIK
jgi:hypothetical protein